MHESGVPGWREVVERHHSAMIAALLPTMVDEISARLDSEVRTAVSSALAAERFQYGQQVARACDEARRLQAELLNQALRRLRHAGSQEQVLQSLAESCAQVAGKVVVLVFENNHARSIAVKGISGAHASGIKFEIAAAPAVVSAIESRDPVVAIAAPQEISIPLAEAFRSEAGDEDDSERAYLFPLLARHEAIAVLVTTGGGLGAPMELLCGTAAMRIEALLTDQPAASIAISPIVQPPGKSERAGWDQLPAEEQSIHLQAQRMARLRVAEMRLYSEEALRQGIGSRDLYGSLRKPLDAARQEFLQTFLSKSSTMVDYLHLEILRSLVNDDDRLLGPEYPGPMV